MNWISQRCGRIAFGLLLVALLGLAVALATTTQAQAPSSLPIETFFPWKQWSIKTAVNQFDLNRCEDIELGDANADGLDDLICAYDYGGNQTRTFVQSSNGTAFTGWTNQHPTILSGFAVDACSPLLSGDLNGDGRVDLICPYDYGSASTATFVQLSLPTGYTAWQQWSAKTGTNQFDLDNCKDMQVGDTNADGLADLICAYDYGGNQTRTFVQTSNGTEFTGWTNQHPTILSGFAVAACSPLLSGDLNGDDRVDLICPYAYPDASTATFVQLSLPTGYTAWQQWSDKTATGQFDVGNCENMQVGDTDADGLADLICAYDYDGDQTRTFVQTSARTQFTNWNNQHPTVLAGFDVDRCEPLLSGDLNNDGRVDLICPYDYGSSSTATFVQLSFSVGYTPWLRATDTLPAGTFALGACRDMAAGDANGDGHADLICPYDYGSGSTATFVELAAVYNLRVPITMR